jgi:23S rRNA-/tRNA-specific pseudouridylate synthase
MDIKTIFEDNNIIVINKPAHLLVHPSTTLGASPAEKNTLIDILKITYPDAELVHRLDQDTSGVMVVAKNHQKTELLRKNTLP